jgi:hypothetical protein
MVIDPVAPAIQPILLCARQLICQYGLRTLRQRQFNGRQRRLSRRRARTAEMLDRVGARIVIAGMARTQHRLCRTIRDDHFNPMRIVAQT